MGKIDWKHAKVKTEKLPFWLRSETSGSVTVALVFLIIFVLSRIKLVRNERNISKNVVSKVV